MVKCFRYNQEDIREDFEYNFRRLKASYEQMSTETVTAYVKLLDELNGLLEDNFEKQRNMHALNLFKQVFQIHYQASLWLL